MSDSRIEYEFRFEPTSGRIYYAYQRPDGSAFVSIVSPDEWGEGYIGTKMIYLHKVKVKIEDGKRHVTKA